MTTDTPPEKQPDGQPDGQRDGQWRVARVDTEPMSTQDYDQAVTALASLIAQWQHNRENSQENTGENRQESA